MAVNAEIKVINLFYLFAKNALPQFISIYILHYDIPKIDEYRSELKKKYNFSDVQTATWIKTRNNTSTSLLLTFKEKEPPIFIEIPGEQAKIKVFEYYARQIWVHSEKMPWNNSCVCKVQQQRTQQTNVHQHHCSNTRSRCIEVAEVGL